MTPAIRIYLRGEVEGVRVGAVDFGIEGDVTVHLDRDGSHASGSSPFSIFNAVTEAVSQLPGDRLYFSRRRKLARAVTATIESASSDLTLWLADVGERAR